MKDSNDNVKERLEELNRISAELKRTRDNLANLESRRDELVELQKELLQKLDSKPSKQD